MKISEIKDRLQVILVWKKNKFWFRVLDMGVSGNGSEGFSKTLGLDRSGNSYPKDRDLLREVYEEMGSEESNKKFIAMYDYFSKVTHNYKKAYEKALLDKNGTLYNEP